MTSCERSLATLPEVACLVLVAMTASCDRCAAADAPERMRRADSFLGIHFDFHAGKDCTSVGKRTTPEMVRLVIDKVRPDYIQIDCKGHPGYSSYPTKVGNPAPGFVGDPLRIWRDVTRQRGMPTARPMVPPRPSLDPMSTSS